MEISVCSSFFSALISIFVSLEFLTPILVPESGFLDKLQGRFYTPLISLSKKPSLCLAFSHRYGIIEEKGGVEKC